MQDSGRNAREAAKSVPSRDLGPRFSRERGAGGQRQQRKHRHAHLQRGDDHRMQCRRTRRRCTGSQYRRRFPAIDRSHPANRRTIVCLRAFTLRIAQMRNTRAQHSHRNNDKTGTQQRNSPERAALDRKMRWTEDQWPSTIATAMPHAGENAAYSSETTRKQA